ncbi:MAG: hypothetical protein IKC50_00360 [Oscillospiraceae bacterium]|nr:hypothetical protein [Oscillospiraceae bacterium]MBR2976717.1 hypothetical protein [Oscillospiraceae bacterium]
MKNTNIFPLRLDLFDADAQGAAETGETPVCSDDTRQSEEAATAAEERPADTEILRKEFDELIRGKYKDVYTERTQAMINRKYAKAKAQAEENAGLRELAGLFARKLGLPEGSDHAQLRAAAEELPEWSRDVPDEEQTAAQAETWLREAGALREQYPDFELREELADPDFVTALQAGVPMELLYKGRHCDRLLAEAAACAAKTAEENVVQSIRAKGGRPAENGADANNSPILTKSDPSQLTLREFEQIARRVSRGERITF